MNRDPDLTCAACEQPIARGKRVYGVTFDVCAEAGDGSLGPFGRHDTECWICTTCMGEAAHVLETVRMDLKRQREEAALICEDGGPHVFPRAEIMLPTFCKRCGVEG